MPLKANLSRLSPTVQELNNDPSMGTLKGHTSDLLRPPASLNSIISGPHELAEVSEVVVEPGVGYLVRLAIHDDHWMLRIGVRVSVDN